MTGIDSKLSELITIMRFPLIACVLFNHSVGFQIQGFTDGTAAGWNALWFTEALLANVLCAMSVRCFFLFSGYLFTTRLQRLKGSIVKRGRTLLVPYLLWNTLMVLASMAVYYGFTALNIPVHEDAIDAVRRGPLMWYVTGPINFPLWYVRDLMVVILLTPALLRVFSGFKTISLILLVVLYLLPVRLCYFPANALFYFGIGYWLRVQGFCLDNFCWRFRFSALALTVITIVLAMCFYTSAYHDLFVKLYCPFGCCTAINLFSILQRRRSIVKVLTYLSGSVFFIYAVHEVFILSWTKGFLVRLLGESLAASWIILFSAPLIALAVCYGRYCIMKRLVPRTLVIMCGGRIN